MRKVVLIFQEIMHKRRSKLQVRVLSQVEAEYALSDRENASQIVDCCLYLKEKLQTPSTRRVGGNYE